MNRTLFKKRMSNLIFTDEFSKKVNIVDKWLKKYLAIQEGNTKVVYEAMHYSVFAGGKRIRPIIMMASYDLFGDKTDCVMPFACAMEMIHTFSLIHDDLPAMDDSPLRRGRPTNHMVFGEAVAVLAGDGLITTAFEVMLESGVEPKVASKAAAYIAKSTGNSGMIGGQIIDISSEGKTIPIEILQELHAKKTGALIVASAVVGAMIGGASDEQISAVNAFASSLGLAFQIKDDILDATGDTSKLGKPVGGDVDNDKNTYVSLLGLAKAQELLNKHTELAKESIAVFGEKAQFLLELTEYLLKRDN